MPGAKRPSGGRTYGASGRARIWSQAPACRFHGDVPGRLRNTLAMRKGLFLLLGSLIASGCGPEKSGADDSDSDGGGTTDGPGTGGGAGTSVGGTGGTDGGTDGATDGGTAAGGTGVTSVTSGGTEVTTGATTTAGGTEGGTGGTGAEVCPPPEGVAASFSLDPDPGFDETISATCTVTSIGYLEGTSVGLECPDEGGGTTAYLLEYVGHLAVEAGLAEGNLVEFEWVTQPVSWINRWFALRFTDGGDLIAAGVDGSEFDPPGTTLNDFLAGPALELFEGQCEQMPADCGPLERVGFDLEYDGVKVRVFDQGSGTAGQLEAYSLSLAQAQHQEDDFTCSDVPGRWYSLVVQQIPEG